VETGAGAHREQDELIQQGADMIQRIPENFSTLDWSLVTTKREGSRSSPPALISARLDDRSRTSSGVDGARVGTAADRQAQIPKVGRRR
jgi:hypothetical protein